MVFDEIQQPVKQLHHAAGWTGTAYTEELVGENPDTGRDEWQLVDADGETCTIRVEWGTQPTEATDESGREIIGDVEIVVDPDELTVISDGDDPGYRATEIVDETDGTRYRTLLVRNEHTGVLRVNAEIVS